VVRIATAGERIERVGGEVRVEVAAGEDWDAFVARMIDAGFGGLECMSGIPGKVGATPIQNVGAYGWEVSEFLRSVRLHRRGSQHQKVFHGCAPRAENPARLRVSAAVVRVPGANLGKKRPRPYRAASRESTPTVSIPIGHGSQLRWAAGLRRQRDSDG
jgi:hypothetical protein